MTSEIELPGRQEKLLQQYLDGECGFIGRKRAELLLRKNALAREFMRSLKSLRSEARGMLAKDVPPPPDRLWERVAMRLEEEERAAFFLGARRIKRERSFPRISWSIPGAAVAAGLAAFFIMQQPDEKKTVASQNESYGFKEASAFPIPAVSLVSQGASRGYQAPRIIEETDVEMDWLRSDGRVSVIPGPNRRGPIIWIKRERAVPYPRSGGGGIRIIEEEVPLTVQVRK